MMPANTYVITTNGPDETEALARELALWIRPGFVVLLEGDLGAGKSVLARALIRSVAGIDELDVPSPSFSLVQPYDGLRVPIVHADLYRLSAAADAAELGLASLLGSHALIVEWPALAVELAEVRDRLSIHITGNGSDRTMTLSANGAWQRALARNEIVKQFLARACGEVPDRSFLQGDASSRRYERVDWRAGHDLLMDMPRQPDGPPVRNNLPYSAIAHLAEGIVPVIAINRHLVELGYSAPRIHVVDQDKGLALIEQLDGDVHGVMMQRGDDMALPMACATDVLASMAAHHWPRQVPADYDAIHVLKDYDEAAQLIEVDLLPSWYWKHARHSAAPETLHQSFEAVWRELLPHAIHDRPYWVLRDYHSPNLIWMPQRQGLRRTGIIDTQDAVMGHPAYDLMSLLQDARCDVSTAMHDALYARYGDQRQNQGEFDAAGFARAYAILGAQRACKLLGIFVRLSLRDGKPQYLQHLPRQKVYLKRNLAHPALTSLKTWFVANLPELLA